VVAALAAVGRLPEREALLVRSWAALVAGRHDEAKSLVDEALARFPDDLEALGQASSIQTQRYDYAGAIPYLERQVALEPEDGATQTTLANLLVELDRREELQRLVVLLEQRTSSPNQERALQWAYVGLGRPDAAVARARTRHERLGTAESRARLLAALGQAGRPAEAEPLVRANLADQPESWTAGVMLADVLAGQGRLREALRAVDEGAYQAQGVVLGDPPMVKAFLLAGLGGPAATWRAAERAVSEDPVEFAFLAIPLALAGDLSHAEEVAAHLPAGAVREQYEALRAWRKGDPLEAASRLGRMLAAGQSPPEGMSPAYLLAEVRSASSDDSGALAAVDRFRRSLPHGWWSGWARLRATLLAAKAHLALGNRDEARREVDRLLADLRRADPDLPLLAEARALRAAMPR